MLNILIWRVLVFKSNARPRCTAPWTGLNPVLQRFSPEEFSSLYYNVNAFFAGISGHNILQWVNSLTFRLADPACQVCPMIPCNCLLVIYSGGDMRCR